MSFQCKRRAVPTTFSCADPAGHRVLQSEIPRFGLQTRVGTVYGRRCYRAFRAHIGRRPGTDPRRASLPACSRQRYRCRYETQIRGSVLAPRTELRDASGVSRAPVKMTSVFWLRCSPSPRFARGLVLRFRFCRPLRDPGRQYRMRRGLKDGLRQQGSAFGAILSARLKVVP